ncbi:ABC-F family ATP-binding cassette domain-containing protein [Pseudalkalibacillus sp. Hm43]|uniref:ABC-F family ATP-binding cassette domain-containing protein n=1 Tax=Pseudalkalibacillus sp. Hm43 TaxID=3450742 RepID=UPI003F42BAD8
MIVMQAQDITKYYGADLILSNIKLEVQSRDRIALVGRNGAGKSTLLKIVSGQLSYDSGAVMKPNEIEIGYLAQDAGLESDNTIWEEMIKVFDHLHQMEEQIRALETKMGQEHVLNDETVYAKVLSEYDALQQKFQLKGGYQYENDIRSILHGFRFYEEDYGKPISSLSGGQKTRLALVKLLLTKPDLLILDEPTNHLDIETLDWLESYLQSYPGALLIVSHDRYFLDKVATQVYEISMTKSKKYLGNYSKYLEAKAEQYEQDLKEFEKQQSEIAKLQDFVQRNIARASTTKRAQSKRKQLQKMEVLDRPDGSEKSAQFGFRIERQTGNDVLKLNRLAIGYEGETLIDDIDLHIQREESIALVGPNGVGKSTLIKTIMHPDRKLGGAIQFGSNVKIGYYDQEQADLNSTKTVLHELWDEFPTHQEKDIRTVLGNFLFSGDDVLKGVNELSGGQKARLALAKLMLQKANVLILDEPTNHLDLDSKEVLENALIDFPGTILFISHDRYFINRIASRVIELSTSGLENFLGDYDYYLEKKAEQAEFERLEREEQNVNQDVNVSDQKEQFQNDKQAKKEERKRLRRIEELEGQIEAYEQQIEEIEHELSQPDVFQDYEKSQELNQKLEEANEGLESLMEEWEGLQSV